MASAPNEAPSPATAATSLGRYDAMVARLCESVLRSPSTLDAPRREAAARGDLDGPLGDFARKVREASHEMSDADFAAVKAAGLSQEQVFELTVSAALGAAKHRLDRAKAAFHGEGSK